MNISLFSHPIYNIYFLHCDTKCNQNTVVCSKSWNALNCMYVTIIIKLHIPIYIRIIITLKRKKNKLETVQCLIESRKSET